MQYFITVLLLVGYVAALAVPVRIISASSVHPYIPIATTATHPRRRRRRRD
jgi:hypothetical protein